jgi:periplasmic copper chaperone A
MSAAPQHRKGPLMRRSIIVLVGAGALALPAAASAHVSLHPNILPVGANATVDVRVPNELDNASTVKVQIKMPPGFLDVSTQPPAGWSAKVTTVKLPKPIQTDDGPVDTRVTEVDFTAASGKGIPPGQFLNFPLSVVVPGKPGQQLTFKTVQTYSNGNVVRWIGGQSADQPAPWIDVASRNAVLQDASGDAGPEQVPTAASGGTADRTTTVVQKESSSNDLSIAALVVAAIGLLLGGAALLVARGRSRAAA